MSSHRHSLRARLSPSRLKATAVALIPALLSMSSCGKATGPSDLVSVEIAVDPLEARPGVPIAISVTATNRSLRRLEVNDKTCPQPFEVLDSDQRVVGPEHLICTLEVSSAGLEPGESITLSSTWSGFGRSGGLDDPVPLTPGEYRLRGWITLRWSGAAYSDPLHISVVP